MSQMSALPYYAKNGKTDGSMVHAEFSIGSYIAKLLAP